MPSGCSARPSAALGAKGWLLLVAPIPCISRGSGVAALFSEPVGEEEGEDRWLWSWPFYSAERQVCSVVPKGYVWESSDTRVASGGLPEAWVILFNIETCLWVPHLQWLIAMSMPQLLGATG